jgi:cytochrome c oxidase assembly protein subunit 11
MTIIPAAVPLQKNVRTGRILLCFACAMLGLSYAAVPLYRLFCEQTGYGGTTQTADTMTFVQPIAQRVNLHFTADVAAGLPWSFKTLTKDINFAMGESQLAFFEITNHSDKPITGTSTFNVTPHEVGPYFVKTECFCYQAQTLQPGETIKLPVSFYVDPEMAKDPHVSKLKFITLSYTFFKSDDATSEPKKL